LHPPALIANFHQDRDAFALNPIHVLGLPQCCREIERTVIGAHLCVAGSQLQRPNSCFRIEATIPSEASSPAASTF
jgi:hypothetical protein